VHSKRCHLSWPIAVEHSVHSCMITNHYTLRWIYIIVCRPLCVLYCRSLSLQFRLPLWCFIPFVEYPSLELSKLKTNSVPFLILVCMVLWVHDGLSHVEQQELPAFTEHLSSPGGVCVARSLVFCVMCWKSLFILFCLPMVLCVLLQLMASDYPFDIFKLFLIMW
jgi:hypothetical protein